MIHIHPRDDHRHFPRAFKSKYVCLLEEREINRNLKQKRKETTFLAQDSAGHAKRPRYGEHKNHSVTSL